MRSAQPARCTILVVEDDPHLRETLISLLTEEGYTVASAADGSEAMQYLQRAELPRLILLDLMMPVMNGWQFRELQQQDPMLAFVPVVIMSAAEKLAQTAQSLGVAGYLAKPFRSESLFETVARHCQ